MLKQNLELNYAHMNVYHAQMQLVNIHSYSYLSCTTESTCIHSSIHSTCSFHIFNSKHGCISKNGQDHLSLWRSHSATSYVTVTFHPTIGQCAPQSLSNAATPELGMIHQGIRELAGLHIAKDIQYTTKPTQLGLSGHQGVGKGLMLSW